MDYTEFYKHVKNELKVTGTDNQFHLYYDETNNFRSFKVDDKGFNADEHTSCKTANSGHADWPHHARRKVKEEWNGQLEHLALAYCSGGRAGVVWWWRQDQHHHGGYGQGHKILQKTYG